MTFYLSSGFWQNFILKTYEAGNKGSKRMKPKQVAVRVQAKAREIGDDKPPSYKTVLRVLKPIIERKQKAKSIRSPGWRGSTLSVKTREGQDLSKVPEVIDEKHLDVCLMKEGRRTVQRGGHLQFENVIYRGENLAGYAGEVVSIRFDPNDITMVRVYRKEGAGEVFLTRAYAQGLETEQLSYEEAKASSKRLRAKGKTISNESILQETPFSGQGQA